MSKIAISDARKNLSDLLKKVVHDPDRVYEITVNDIVFGELRSPSHRSLRMHAGDAILEALQELTPKKKRENGNTARDHNRYLYPQRSRTKN